MKKIFAIGIFMLIANLLSAQTTIADSIMKLDADKLNAYKAELSIQEIDQQAEFLGGYEGLYKFLNTTLKYPQDCVESGIQGSTHVEFMVCTDGSICDYKIKKYSGNKTLDAEAMRVVKMIRTVKPASEAGVAVASYYSLPITFMLESNQKKQNEKHN
jgi:TonB family protein